MKRFGKIVAVAAACAALTGTVAAFSACGNGGDETESYDITITGSTSMEDVMGALADEFMAAKEEEGVDVTITITANGSGQGINDASLGNVDFGMSSRALNDDDPELESQTICLDGIAVVVDNECGIESVTKSQLVDLYLNGTPISYNGGQITGAFRREGASGTRDGFETALGIKGQTMYDDTNEFREFNSTGALKTAITQTQTALGYISMASVDSTVKALRYDAEDGKGAVEATKENVLNGSYGISRPFVICYQDYDALSDITKEFIEFIMSEEGQQICEDEGCISEVLAQAN